MDIPLDSSSQYIWKYKIYTMRVNFSLDFGFVNYYDMLMHTIDRIWKIENIKIKLTNHNEHMIWSGDRYGKKPNWKVRLLYYIFLWMEMYASIKKWNLWLVVATIHKRSLFYVSLYSLLLYSFMKQNALE